MNQANNIKGEEGGLKMKARRASLTSDVWAQLRLKATAWAWLLTAQAFETLRLSPSHE